MSEVADGLSAGRDPEAREVFLRAVQSIGSPRLAALHAANTKRI